MKLNQRQIHLDFHTSQYIPEVGAAFDPDEFADTFKAADVNSVTVFARDHHGWIYYPSERFGEIVHPHLVQRDLLLQQIEALHARDIRAPIYVTVQWDHVIMREHPEWLCRDPDGEPINMQNTPEPNFYDFICLNSPYRDYLKRFVHDVIDVVGAERVDGFFFDIVLPVPCDCVYCQAQMARRGIDHTDAEARLAYSLEMLHDFKMEMYQLIETRVKDASIFFNSSTISPAVKQDLAATTHLEIESLPSGGWGYDHFPVTARYARTLGKPLVGMTGKFHTYWGDFNSLKEASTLAYEVQLMLALNVDAVSIGDQMDPTGKLSPAAYDLIGGVYHQVAALAPHLAGDVPTVETAVLMPPVPPGIDVAMAVIGVKNLLTELNVQFDFIDADTPLTPYRLVIVPEGVTYSKALSLKLRAFKETGGALISSGGGMLNERSTLFGLTRHGDDRWQRSFIVGNDVIGQALPKEPLVMYLQAIAVQAAGATSLLETRRPYFNREGKTFISHQHAPATEKAGQPALWRYDNTFTLTHPLFTIYAQYRPAWLKVIFRDLLRLALPNQLVHHDGPATLQVYVNGNTARHVSHVHLLNYVIAKQASKLYTVDPAYPTAQLTIDLTVRTQTVKAVTGLINGAGIAWQQIGRLLQIRVPSLIGYEVLEVQYQA
ncbi:alpha-amylase family protein [Lacticaseibacillus mingshuiensis]|uniref:Beta-galactosidase trimerization domain-containing protein n=1 Tax=Lacticaseibacillus mingshuiensis TaxID=2799574 RepID=A0ABW4CIB7_9LACO|nr:alpha-amylase family protein [Lacticaseibacillus mingshuiensis]